MKTTGRLTAFGDRRGSLGFSMVEVLVVIAILAILASLAVPGFTRWLPNYRLNGATRDFYSNLQLARSWAIRDRANTVITFDGNSYEVTRDGGGTSLKTVNLDDYGSGVSFGPASALGNIEFSPMGMTTNPDSVLVYMTNNRNRVLTIEIYPSGTASLRN